MVLHHVSKKTAKLFLPCNFVKFPPTLTIFGTRIVERTHFCEVPLFSNSPNSRQRPTMLNADVPNCYIAVIISIRLLTFASSIRDIKYSTLEIADNKTVDIGELKTRLIDEWAQFDQSIIGAAISQWRCHLSAYVRVRGAH